MVRIRIRINGRTLRPGCLVSRRFFLGSLGVDSIRVPRAQNPYAIARRIARHLKSEDLAFLAKMASKKTPVPPVSPDVDRPEPSSDDDHVAAAE